MKFPIDIRLYRLRKNYLENTEMIISTLKYGKKMKTVTMERVENLSINQTRNKTHSSLSFSGILTSILFPFLRIEQILNSL